MESTIPIEFLLIGSIIFSGFLFTIAIIFVFRARSNPQILLPTINNPNLHFEVVFYSQNQSNQSMISQIELSSLPTIKLSKTDSCHLSKLEGRCCICLDKFNEGDIITTLPCFHIFHSSCIEAWLKMNKVCPLCKTWK
ncbi:hypothetical protein M0811_00084 [Anaeramoeba ignava]|uniref:RING-type domain-containing protein n=1 Tax=Anaeramoeba ignava TaxID=1746090 RepID=A0A9Q0RE29_ANAIG|nr:hypothetical protein M0811_00084 [Anaeramoeba ignava]